MKAFAFQLAFAYKESKKHASFHFYKKHLKTPYSCVFNFFIIKRPHRLFEILQTSLSILQINLLYSS